MMEEDNTAIVESCDDDGFPGGFPMVEDLIWLYETETLLRKPSPPSSKWWPRRPATLCNMLRCRPGPEHYLDFDNLEGK